MTTTYKVLYDAGARDYLWETVRAERFKIRNGTARFYIGYREVAYFYDIQAVVEDAE